VVMTLLVAAAIMFSNTVVSVARQQTINRENAVAAEAARAMLEVMRNRPPEQIFALFNTDPSDDPAGPGTAPGSGFAIPGLDVDPGDPDGLQGEIRFPGVDVGPLGGPVDLVLRENVDDPLFGLPRDLNGDSIIDGADHTGDYLVLPVQVRVRWTGRAGAREYRTFATFCDFKWE